MSSINRSCPVTSQVSLVLSLWDLPGISEIKDGQWPTLSICIYPMLTGLPPRVHASGSHYTTVIIWTLYNFES